MKRIEATNFALANDDGGMSRNYDVADVILVGVSRSGKTPTCLYLALQYGVYAANYPLTDEELETGTLPDFLLQQKPKLVDHCAGATSGDTEGTSADGPLFVGTTGTIRVARGGQDISSLRYSKRKYDELFD